MVGACTTRPPGIGDVVDWSSLQSWGTDNRSDAEVRAFFESNFQVRPVYAEDCVTEGLITGYYEPLLKDSWERSEDFQYPLYGVPRDLLQGSEILWVNSLVDVFFLHAQNILIKIEADLGISNVEAVMSQLVALNRQSFSRVRRLAQA